MVIEDTRKIVMKLQGIDKTSAEEAKIELNSGYNLCLSLIKLAVGI